MTRHQSVDKDQTGQDFGCCLYYRAGSSLSDSASNFVALCRRYWGL